MLPNRLLDVARVSEKMYEDAISGAGSGDQDKFALEIAKRRDEFKQREPGSITWTFESRLTLIRWTWKSRIAFSYLPDPQYAVWDKPVECLSQFEISESLHSLAMRWREIIPCPKLYEWIIALDSRLAQIATCVGDAKIMDESWESIEKTDGRVASDTFLVDRAAIVCDMIHDYLVWGHFRYMIHSLRKSKPKPAHFNIWFQAEKARLTSDSKSKIQEQIESLSIRPGELSIYARIPRDHRAILRLFRPPTREYKRSHSLEPYLLFNHYCARLGFDWLKKAFLLERDYFLKTEAKSYFYEVANHLAEPVVFRILGVNLVLHHGNAFLCASAEEAIATWIDKISAIYQSDATMETWDLTSLKQLLLLPTPSQSPHSFEIN